MHFRNYVGALAFGAVLFGASCANMNTVQNAAVEDAESQSFDAEYTKVVDTGVGALRALRLVVTSQTENAVGTTILFIRTGSNGAVGRMIVEKSAAPPTMVRINYERRMTFTFAAGQEGLSRKVFERMQGEIRFSGPTS